MELFRKGDWLRLSPNRFAYINVIGESLNVVLRRFIRISSCKTMALSCTSLIGDSAESPS